MNRKEFDAESERGGKKGRRGEKEKIIFNLIRGYVRSICSIMDNHCSITDIFL